jgi:predicted metal-binding membrane protein
MAQDTRATRAGPLQILPWRRLALPWLVATAVAALAWIVTVVAARRMGNGPGTMGLRPLGFVGMWIMMMTAMMLPSVAPVGILWARTISGQAGKSARGMRLSLFLLIWAALGIVAYAVLAAGDRLLGVTSTGSKWLGIAIFLVAGTYQITPWKDRCLHKCRSPVGALMHYMSFKGWSRDLRVGIHHGASCLGCCWGLMILLVAVGIMNVPVMAGLAVVILLEKLWRHGKGFGRAVGFGLMAIGVLANWLPWLLPGLHAAM